MACLHNHSCEENNCSSDWSLYKHDDRPEDPWETLLLSPSLTESPGLATRTNVVAERTDVVPTEGAAGEDTSIWSMTLRIFLATIVVNYFEWAIQDSNLAKVVTGGIVVLVTSPTVIYHCWYCYVLRIHAKNLRTWTLPSFWDCLRAFLAVVHIGLGIFWVVLTAIFKKIPQKEEIMQVLNQKFNGTKPKQVEFIGYTRSEFRPYMCIIVTYYFLYAVGIYYHLNYKSRFVTLWRLIKQFVSSPLHVTMWKIDRYQRLEDLESGVLELQLDREGQEIADVWLNGDLPRVVMRSLSQGSHVTSMDFHPEEHTLLLVGTDVGNISIWEVGSRKQTAITFRVWKLSACSMPFQTTFVKDATISVNRCAWGPDGSKLGVAFSKHIVQIYTYDPKGELGRHLEIDAHAGGVNDIAFARLKEQLCIVTCGDDKTIKVWDADFGRRQHTFGGHEAPVYSVCLRPHYNENSQFIIFSTATDGKIKAWQYDSLGSRGDYDAPGLCCTTMAYSADRKRLFSCGTSKEGESHLVEWNESKGAIKRTYSGFLKRSLGVVQFDTTQNRFLAAGDEFQIKFWDMDNTNMLTHSECDGELPASPRLRFNKEGSLLAVTTSDNGIKILANLNGQHMLRMLESRANTKRQTADMKRRTRDKIKSCKFTDIADSSQLKTLKLPDTLTASKIVRLLYTNSGLAVLALASNAVHKLWKWQCNEQNPAGKSSATSVPQLWQPNDGALMSNNVNDAKPAEDSVVCIASKNDSCVMSASGGKVSWFNMTTFKVTTTFMPHLHAATYLAFHPQDNDIIAIGMEDFSIQIYNFRVNEVKTKLNGHQERISGLAFSQNLNILVSSGADAQLCIWNIDGWAKKKSRLIQAPTGQAAPLVGETRVQFRNNESHLLVVHESQIAVYDAHLKCLRAWYPRESLSAPISSGIYSCDGLLIFTGFCDGAVGIFDAESLNLRCRVAPSAYMPASVSSSGNTFPIDIAAHPSDRYQFALGMSDGAVHVMEPLDAGVKWGGAADED